MQSTRYLVDSSLISVYVTISATAHVVHANMHIKKNDYLQLLVKLRML